MWWMKEKRIALALGLVDDEAVAFVRDDGRHSGGGDVFGLMDPKGVRTLEGRGKIVALVLVYVTFKYKKVASKGVR